MTNLKIVCLVGGPAALYFSILMKKRNPGHDITIFERGPRNDVLATLRADPQLEPIREVFSPRFIRFFERLKEEGEAEPLDTAGLEE